jgi:hypothetical protein
MFSRFLKVGGLQISFVDKKTQDYILNIHALDFEHVNALIYLLSKAIPFLISYLVFKIEFDVGSYACYHENFHTS